MNSSLGGSNLELHKTDAIENRRVGQRLGVTGTIRVGIVGCGRISEIHGEILRSIPGLQIVGFCDSAIEKARSVAASHGVERYFDRLDSMLTEVRPHAIHVLTPPDSHRELVGTAASHGVHSYVEKPIASTGDEALAIAEQARDNGVIVCPGHNRLFDPVVIEARKRIESGSIGRVVFINVEQGFSYGPGARGATPHWSFTYPWGVYDNLMPHALYLASEHLADPGPPSVVGFDLGRFREVALEEIRATILGSNAVAEVVFSANSAPEAARIEYVGTGGRLVVDTLAMTIVASTARGLPASIARFTRGIGTSNQLIKWTARNAVGILTGRLRRYPGMWNLIAEFYRSIRNGRPSPVSIESAVLNAVQLESIKALCADKVKPTLRLVSAREASPVDTLVTGATGLVGRRLTQRLSARGVPVRASARLASRTEALDRVTWVPLDLRNEESVRAALEGARTVYHCAALVTGTGTSDDFEKINVAGTLRLARIAAEVGVQRIVYLSSVSVFGLQGARRRRLGDRASYDAHARDRGAYTQSKLSAEIAILDWAAANPSPKIVLLRPGLIYGPGAPVPFGKLRLPSSESRPLVVGPRDSPMPLSYLDNVIDGMLLAATADVPSGSAYNLVDDPDLSQGTFAETLRAASGGFIRPVFVPRFVVWPLMLALDLFSFARGRGLGTARYRMRRTLARLHYLNDGARASLRWEPRIGLREGLERALAGRD